MPKLNTGSSATADGPRDALMSVKIFVNCRNKFTTNPPQSKSRSYTVTVDRKQPRLVDCRIGVVNKLDRRRRRRRVLLTTRSIRRGEIVLSSEFGTKFQTEVQ